MPELISQIRGFIGKVDDWYRKTLKMTSQCSILNMYPEYVDTSNQIPKTEMQDNITTNLINLSDKLKMYIPEIDNHVYNIALHTFYADIEDIDEYNLEQIELIMMQHDISAKHEFETQELGFFRISFLDSGENILSTFI